MKLVIKNNDGPVSAEQHVRVTAAIQTELATTKYTFADAMLGWIEYLDLMEIAQQKNDLTQDRSDWEERFRIELTDADRKFLATPDEELVTWQPEHEEREALWFRLNEVAMAVAGERIWFYDTEEEHGPMQLLQTTDQKKARARRAEDEGYQLE